MVKDGGKWVINISDGTDDQIVYVERRVEKSAYNEYSFWVHSQGGKFHYSIGLHSVEIDEHKIGQNDSVELEDFRFLIKWKWMVNLWNFSKSEDDLDQVPIDST